MKKLSIIFMFIACLFVTACSNDDEPKTGLTAEFLMGTTWGAELTGSTTADNTPVSTHFAMQFLTKDSGKCIPNYDDNSYEGSFTYNIKKGIITFNGSFVGNWTIVEYSKSKIVLQSFQPNEVKLVLSTLYAF